ncbi:MAG: polysaccharide deacetylase family protein [Deltaproteobacteria bacterium]|nr:polysaccharide deacetylase family protein [Deltaproteobacteria bacterium]
MAIRHFVRDLGAQLFWHLRISQPRRAAADRLTIVTFHRVLPDPNNSPLPHLAVTPAFLRGCLDFFADHYTCLTVSQATERFFSGDRPTRPLLAVTFDDGRKDGFLHALTALRASHVPATFYVPAGCVEDTKPLWHDALAWIVRRLKEQGATDAVRAEVPGLGEGDLAHAVVQQAKQLSEPDRDALIARLGSLAGSVNFPFWEQPMSWSELRQLAQEGHEIGSHSMSHTVLREELGADQHREVTESRHLLEENLNGSVTSFCFPTGEYDDATLRELNEAGYQNAVTTRPGPNDGEANRFELRRFDVQGPLNSNRRGELKRAVLAWRLSRLPGAPG